jgi:hypothetical protein
MLTRIDPNALTLSSSLAILSPLPILLSLHSRVARINRGLSHHVDSSIPRSRNTAHMCLPTERSLCNRICIPLPLNQPALKN